MKIRGLCASIGSLDRVDIEQYYDLLCFPVRSPVCTDAMRLIHERILVPSGLAATTTTTRTKICGHSHIKSGGKQMKGWLGTIAAPAQASAGRFVGPSRWAGFPGFATIRRAGCRPFALPASTTRTRHTTTPTAHCPIPIDRRSANKTADTLVPHGQMEGAAKKDTDLADRRTRASGRTPRRHQPLEALRAPCPRTARDASVSGVASLVARMT